MAELDKVIEGLKICFGNKNCDGCPYETACKEVADSLTKTDWHCPILDDALELLKKQKPMKPTVHGTWTDGFTTYEAYYCKSCNGLLQKNDWQVCPCCGQAVKWE